MQKKYFILLTLFFSVNFVYSQTVLSSQNATASAYLVVPLSIAATIGDLDFGNILLAGSATKTTIEPLDGKLFVVSGHPNRKVTFTFENVLLDNASWVVAHSGLVGNLTFVPKVILENGRRVKSGKSKKLVLDGSVGKLNVWVGGSIKISANQEVGEYIGRFTLSVNY